MRTSLARTSIVLTASILLLALAGCGGSRNQAAAIEEEISRLTNHNSWLEDQIEENESDLAEGLLDSDLVAQANKLRDLARKVESEVDSILDRCDGAEWCQAARDHSNVPATAETLAIDDVEELGNVISALASEADKLLETCTASSTCRIAPTTTAPKSEPKPTDPPRQDRADEENDRPECEQVILLRALAIDSRGSAAEIDYLISAAYALPIDWSMTAGFILDDLSYGAIQSAYNRIALFIDTRCPSNR